MWDHYFCVASIDEALKMLANEGSKARIVAGGTDLLLEMERNVRKGIETLIDITRVTCLDEIRIDEDEIIHLGPMVTHNHCAGSKLVTERLFPLAQACWQVGAPQIRNRGTVAGNLITASPANDTISPLMALGASLRLASARGERVVPIADFFKGVRKTVLEPDEMLVDIAVPAMQANQRGMFYKLGLRRAQAISVVNASVVLTFAKMEVGSDPVVEKASITLGSVAPVIVHAAAAEAYLAGKALDDETVKQAALLAAEAAIPIDDMRSSARYRSEMVRVGVLRNLEALRQGAERAGYPLDPVLLWGDQKKNRPVMLDETTHLKPGAPIKTRINGQPAVFTSGHGKTLLRFLREEALLIGTKEGCDEGECGACTIFLDGKAVMACLVPAERAHLAEITTVEGLAKNGTLSPLQQSFIDEGAVQCGYCTPGFLMSATKLLEERPYPTHNEVLQAITGNLCRCTGYYKIVQAIEKAGQLEA